MTLSNLVAAIDSERQHGKVTPLVEINDEGPDRIEDGGAGQNEQDEVPRNSITANRPITHAIQWLGTTSRTFTPAGIAVAGRSASLFLKANSDTKART
jgi:hypothetical protein